VGGGVGEHVGQGMKPQARAVRDGEPAGREQGADLADRPGDRRPVHPVQPGQGRVGELVAQDDEGDDDAAGERQLAVRARAGGAQTLVTSAFKQPGLLAGGPLAGQAGDEPAEAARREAGEDTLAQGRAAQVLRHNNT
jgi:hypothetical protein